MGIPNNQPSLDQTGASQIILRVSGERGTESLRLETRAVPGKIGDLHVVPLMFTGQLLDPKTQINLGITLVCHCCQ
jgi:hypothetical protein